MGRDVMLRKTMFDDCKGEKFIEMMTAFSIAVLQRVLSSLREGKASIARQICTQPTAVPISQPSHSVLLMAHRISLRNHLARRKTLRARYLDFGQALDMKDKEVEKRFASIVETQDYLDQNIAPEATVARITKQFEEHWHADPRFIQAVTRGDEVTAHDAFLDRSFTKVWFEVTAGTHAPDFSSSCTGILDELENRVAVQATRLHEWKRYRSEMQQKHRSPPKIDSPIRNADAVSPKHRAADKDSVFSPRKSPRKSEGPVRPTPIATPIKSSPSFAYRKDSPSDALNSPSSPLHDRENFLKRRQSHVQPAPKDTPETDHNNSGFSEISDHDLTSRFDLNINQAPASSTNDARASLTHAQIGTHRLDAEGFAIPSTKPMTVASPASTRAFDYENIRNPPKVNDEAYHANAILAATFNTVPTPTKAPLTLEERTRQSLALASPSCRLATHPPKAKTKEARQSLGPQPEPSQPVAPTVAPSPAPPPRLNLAERTRQSISAATINKPKAASRKSLAGNRRDSRVFPVNQFETPGRGRRISGFDESAGYDSVFKSRPRVVVSPQSTPVEEGEEDQPLVLDRGAGVRTPLEKWGGN